MKILSTTIWNNKQRGFISIPLLIITILSAVVVSGAGYAVYKVNQIEKESSSKIEELERQFNSVSTSTHSTDPNQYVFDSQSAAQDISDSATEESAATKDFVDNTVVSSSNNFNYVIVDSRTGQLNYARELLKKLPDIYMAISNEKSQFMRIKSETESNLRNAGYTELEIKNEILIQVYTEYLVSLDSRTSVLSANEALLKTIVKELELSKLEASNKLITYAEAVSFVASDTEGESLEEIGKNITGVNERFYSMQQEIRANIAAYLGGPNEESVATEPFPKISLPTFTDTRCTSDGHTIKCSGLTY